MNIKLIYPALSRAVNIAVCGGLTLYVHVGPDYKNGRDDMDYLFKTHGVFKGLVESETVTLTNGNGRHISFEVGEPEFENIPFDAEPIRVETTPDKAKDGIMPCEKMPVSTDALIRSASKYLNLKGRLSIPYIAKTIAIYDNANKIEIEHVAEAIQLVTTK